MPDNLPNNNPLSYLGVRPEHPPEIIKAARAPTINDKNHKVGDTWIDEVGESAYIMVAVTASGAVWDQYALSSGGPIDTVTGDGGPPVTPTGGNINIVGGDLINTNGAGSTLTLNTKVGGYPVTPFVVDGAGNASYTTIQSALDSADALGGGVIVVRPGTYTENLILYGNTSVRGITNSDAGTAGNSVIISGTHIPPATGSFVFDSVFLSSATDIFNSAVAGSALLFLLDCIMQVTNGYTFNLPNWTGTLVTYNVGDISTDNGMVLNNGGSTCFFLSATHGRGNANSMITSGPLILEEIDLNCPLICNGATVLQATYAQLNNTVTFNNTSSGSLTHSVVRDSVIPTAAKLITMSSSGNFQFSDTVIDTANTPAIDGAGAGTIDLSEVSFLAQSAIAGTVNISRNSHNETGIVSARGLDIQEGTNARMGTVNFTAGLALVATTAVTATSRIFLTINTPGGTIGSPYVFNRTPGVDFTISSTNGADGSAVAWMIVEPA